MSELNYTSLKAGRRVMVKKQTVVECVLHTDKDIKIAKVLSLSADGSIAASESLSKELKYNGRINFKVIFMNNDGGLSKLNYYADFSDKIEDETITPTSYINNSGEVIDVNTVSLTENEISLACVFEVSLEILKTEEFMCIAKSEDLHIKSEVSKTCEILARSSANFDIAEQKSVKNTVSDILCSDADIIVNSTFAANDMLICEGEVIVNITYGDNVKDEILGISFTMPYKFEIEAKGSDITKSATCQAVINYLEVSVSVDEEKNESIFSANANIKLLGVVYNLTDMTVVTDVFSETNEVNPVISGINMNNFEGTVYYAEKVEGSVELSDNMSDIINILCCCGTRVNIVSYAAMDKNLNLEGIINTNVLFMDREGKKNSAQAEIPFSINIENDIIKRDCIIKSKAMVCDIYAKSKKGKDLDIFVAVKICADIYSSTTLMAVTEVELTTIKQSENTISIYFAQENESFWDVAKQLNCSEAMIIKQNPNLSVPFNGGEQVVIYRQKILKI